MDKPKKEYRVNPTYDYHEVIDYIEEKYNINTRDYANRHKHFLNWLKLMNEEPPNYPICPGSKYQVNINGEMVDITKEDYDARYKVIHEQYARFNEWCKSNPEPLYLDFWHWLIENDFEDIHNGSHTTLNIRYWLDKLDEDDWQREILQLICSEFKEDDMEFWVEW